MPIQTAASYEVVKRLKRQARERKLKPRPDRYSDASLVIWLMAFVGEMALLALALHYVLEH